MTDDNRTIAPKPPLGVTPENIWIEQRISELSRAVTEYMATGMSVNPDWITEYNGLILSETQVDVT